ncbi:MAG: sodium:solute symporter family protein [Pseudomonadota bacterium]
MQTVDYIIFWSYLVVILGTGLWVSRSVKDLKDYAIGGKSYSAFFVFATLSSSFIGGGFTTGLAEKTYTLGLFYVVALWGFSLKEILVAKYIAPRMQPFSSMYSVGEIMGSIYGEKVRIITGIAGALVCAGIAGAQFSAFGYIVHIFMDIPPVTGLLIGAFIVVCYSTLGGMKAVVTNDTIHFCVLIIALPLVLIFGIYQIGGVNALFTHTPVTAFTWSMGSVLTLSAAALSLFFGETLVPPYMQRLLIGKTIQETIRGTLWSGLLSIPFFLLIGIIGLIAFSISPDIAPNLALPYVIQTVMPAGLKGFAIAGMMAVIMSSADSFLNAASVSIVHDVLKPLQNARKRTFFTQESEIQWTRIATLCVGIAGIIFSIGQTSALDVLLMAYNFWTPVVLVPLIAGIFGYKAPAQAFWLGSALGILSTLLWNVYIASNLHIEGSLIGIVMNCITFVWVSKNRDTSNIEVNCIDRKAA